MTSKKVKKEKESTIEGKEVLKSSSICFQLKSPKESARMESLSQQGEAG